MSQFLRKKILGPHWFRGSCRLHIFRGPTDFNSRFKQRGI